MGFLHAILHRGSQYTKDEPQLKHIEPYCALREESFSDPAQAQQTWRYMNESAPGRQQGGY